LNSGFQVSDSGMNSIPTISQYCLTTVAGLSIRSSASTMAGTLPVIFLTISNILNWVS